MVERFGLPLPSSKATIISSNSSARPAIKGGTFPKLGVNGFRSLVICTILPRASAFCIFRRFLQVWAIFASLGKALYQAIFRLTSDGLDAMACRKPYERGALSAGRAAASLAAPLPAPRSLPAQA